MKHFKRTISAFLAVSALVLGIPCNAEEIYDNSANLQLLYSNDILTLDSYYDPESSRIFSEMTITRTDNMPEIYCSYDNIAYVLTEASSENRYSFPVDINSQAVYVKAVQTLSDGTTLVSDIITVYINDAALASDDCCDDDEYLGYIPNAHLAEPIAVIPTAYVPTGFAEMFYMYPSGSYFSQTGVACTCHGGNCDYSYEGGCDCIPFQKSIQCMAFAKMAYYTTHGNTYLGSLTEPNTFLTTQTAKSLFMNTSNHTLGTYLRVRTTKEPRPDGSSDHSIAIITTTTAGLTIYHANYGGGCKVSYQTYTWENFVETFPFLYSYAK